MTGQRTTQPTWQAWAIATILIAGALGTSALAGNAPPGEPTAPETQAAVRPSAGPLLQMEASEPEKVAMPPPPWYTEEVHEQVLEASSQGLGYDLARNRTVTFESPFIRPGAWIVHPHSCTTGFVVGSPGSYQILTAGHCILDKQKDAEFQGITVPHPGREIFRPVAEANGATVHDKTVVLLAEVHSAQVLVALNPSSSATAVENKTKGDYAIVPINNAWQDLVDPTVRFIAGPEPGVYDEELDPSNPVPVKHIGHGLGIGTGGTPRAGVTIDEEEDFPTVESSPYIRCACVFNTGDSGGPVLAITPENPLGVALGLVVARMNEANGGALVMPLTGIPGIQVAPGTMDIPNPVPQWLDDVLGQTGDKLNQCLEEVGNGPDLDPPFDQPCIEDPHVVD